MQNNGGKENVVLSGGSLLASDQLSSTGKKYIKKPSPERDKLEKKQSVGRTVKVDLAPGVETLGEKGETLVHQKGA